MSGPLRIEYPGAFYHVTSRGNERRRVFQGNRDRERFLSYFESTHERYGAVIHGMSFHYLSSVGIIHFVVLCILDAASDTIPILTYIGRTISLHCGSFLANIRAPKKQDIPPIINVFGAPIFPAKPPANKLPNGAIPLSAIA